MSPLVWDLGHIAAYEDLWISHRFGARPLLRPDFAHVYDAFETPRSHRSKVRLLSREECEEYVRAVRGRTIEVIERGGVGDGGLIEMVVRHECQHTETMLQTIQLARLRDFGPTRHSTPPAVSAAHTGLQLVDVPAGPFELGAPSGRFSYDNERPRQVVDVDAFRIGRTRSLTNADWLSFIDGAGYQDRQWWSPQGWAWEWTGSHFLGYPGFVAHPYRQYSEVFFGAKHNVLRGGSWATSARGATPTFRNWDLPQRRQIFAGVRLASDD